MAKSKNSKAAVSKSSKTRVDASTIVETEFGRYRIKAGRLTGNFVARAFLKARSNGHGMMAEASGGSEDEAIAALKSLLSGPCQRNLVEPCCARP